MKKSYKLLTVFEILVILLILINSFFWKFLVGYWMPVFLVIVLFVFNKIFLFERNKSRYSDYVSKSVIIFLLTFLIAYYLIGLLIGFAKTTNYLTLYGVFRIIIPLILTIVLEEFLRYEVLIKTEGSKFLPILTFIMFILLHVTNYLSIGVFTSAKELFMFNALYLLPNITINIMLNHISRNAGYYPTIIYRLIYTLYEYLVPLVPNANLYIKSMIDFLLPLIMYYKTYLFFQNEEDEYMIRDYKTLNYKFIFPVATVIFLVYFISGYFRYYAIAIATGSMSPQFSTGDVVVVDQKCSGDKIKKGDVIAFLYNDTIIVHRVYNIISASDGNYIFTKGDANTEVDSWSIKSSDVIGKVEFRIKYIGLPTILINELTER